MFVSDDIISHSRFLNPRKPRNKKLTSRNKSNRRNLLLPKRKNMGPVDNFIQEITDEYGILDDITIESASTMGSVGSGDSGETVVAMENSGNKTKCHHMGGPSSHVHLYHNSSPYYLFNLMIIEEFSRGILQ